MAEKSHKKRVLAVVSVGVMRRCYKKGEELPIMVVEERLNDGLGAFVFISDSARLGYCITGNPDGGYLVVCLFGNKEYTDNFDSLRAVLSAFGLDFGCFRYISAQAMAQEATIVTDD